MEPVYFLSTAAKTRVRKKSMTIWKAPQCETRSITRQQKIETFHLLKRTEGGKDGRTVKVALLIFFYANELTTVKLPFQLQISTLRKSL